MSTYETVIVLHSRLSDPEVATFVDKTKAMITKGGGEILSEDRWGRRKLAYPIRHAREGFYLYFKFQAKGSLIDQLNHQYRIQDVVLRTLTVHDEESRRKTAEKPAKVKAKVNA
jgi:small subunit ribosomal protein S6